MRQLKSLKVFLAVIEYGTFSAAAEHVFLTAAAVGQQVKALEDDLGFMLFDRVGKSIVLNHRGHQFAKRAAAILQLIDEARYDQDARDISGSIRVASISTAIPYLVKAIIDMRWKYPNVNVEPGISYSGNLRKRVVFKEIDAALSVVLPHDRIDDCVCTPMYKEPICFVYNKNSFLHEDINQITKKSVFFHVESNNNTGIIINELIRQIDLKIDNFIKIDAIRSIYDIVNDGHGVSILPVPYGMDIKNFPNIGIINFNGPFSHRIIALIENSSNTFLTSLLRKSLKEKAPNSTL